MRPISVTLPVRVPRDRLFTHLATAWEAGDPLGAAPGGAGGAEGPDGRGGSPGSPGSGGRIGVGFTVRCPGRGWALPDGVALTVDRYAPPEGWRAVSAAPFVVWETRLGTDPATPADRARLTCRVGYRPAGAAGRLRELVLARRRRARALRRLLGRWRDDAERREALRRLRGAQGPSPRT